MRALNLPNLLTISRLVLAPVIPISFIAKWSPFWYLDIDYRVAVFFVALFLALTDFFDGFFARRWHQETALGKKLEPTADFVLCVSLLATVLNIFQYYPILFYVSIVFACYFIGYGMTAIQLRRQRGIDCPNTNAKRGVFALMSAMLLVILGTFVQLYGIWLAAIGLVVLAILLTSEALDDYEKLAPSPDCTCSKDP